MDRRDNSVLKLLSTGVPGLDTVMGGGLPEYSFNLIAGKPGSGKTTFMHQLIFANASAERPALYFTVLGEPALKMLRYQQQMSFFDRSKVGTHIRFIDLSREVLEGDLERLLAAIVREVEETNPSLVVVDSFSTVARQRNRSATEELELQGFLQRLGMHLTSWQVTSFVIGEYAESEMQENPVFTIADAIIWLSQTKRRSSSVRELEIVKMRGMATMPGSHTFRISSDGLQVFPRNTPPQATKGSPSATIDTSRRATFGMPLLDDMFDGGIPLGDTTLIGGPSGTGKTVLSTHFIAQGALHGEPGVLAIFEERPSEYIARAALFGFELQPLIDSNMLRVLSVRPLDLSADETLFRLQEAVAEIGAKRLVIDSLTGLEIAIAPNFRDDFRESLYRTIGALSDGGVTVLLTVEIVQTFEDLKFSPHAVSFLAQNIVLLRYVEVDATLRKVMTIVKMRRSKHSNELEGYDITPRGIVLTRALRDYQGILTGVAVPRAPVPRQYPPGLTDLEVRVLETLLRLRSAGFTSLFGALDVEQVSVRSALERLVELNHVVASGDGDDAVFRPLVRPLGT